MRSYNQTAEFMRSMIPVSRFNKGEASKIFDEVEKSGMGIVVKNNKPTCVLLSPQRYEEVMEDMENMYLSMVAEKRLEENSPYHSSEDVMKRLGISEEDLESSEDVVIE